MTLNCPTQALSHLAVQGHLRVLLCPYVLVRHCVDPGLRLGVLFKILQQSSDSSGLPHPSLASAQTPRALDLRPGEGGVPRR